MTKETTRVREDGLRFPVYENELLSWSPGLYYTWNEQQAGFPRMRAVIRAMRQYRPLDLERERRELLKASFDRMFGHNARKALEVLEQEITYLKDFGAWDDLQTADAETLAQRVLWIAAGDQDESGEPWLGMMH